MLFCEFGLPGFGFWDRCCRCGAAFRWLLKTSDGASDTKGFYRTYHPFARDLEVSKGWCTCDDPHKAVCLGLAEKVGPESGASDVY